MIKLISFIVLTHFFQFNQLKNLRQPGLQPAQSTILVDTLKWDIFLYFILTFILQL